MTHVASSLDRLLFVAGIPAVAVVGLVLMPAVAIVVCSPNTVTLRHGVC